MESNSLNEAED